MIDDLLAADEALWAEEARVCRDDFRSAARSRATGLAWVMRRAAKELMDGVEPRRRALAGETDPARVAALAGELQEEAAHDAAFAVAYDCLREPVDPGLDVAVSEKAAAWPANVELGGLRRRRREEHGRPGVIAALVTEGGRAALFAEGAALAGRGGADDVIAAACAVVRADEVRHMERGVDDLAALDLSPVEWDLVTDMTVAQSRQRILMREEQNDAPTGRGATGFRPGGAAS